MTDSTETGVRVTLRGNKKKRIRQQRNRHSTMEMNTYSFLKMHKQIQNNRMKQKQRSCWFVYLKRQTCLRASGFQPYIITWYYSNKLVFLACNNKGEKKEKRQ